MLCLDTIYGSQRFKTLVPSMTKLHTWRKAPVQAWCRNCLNLNLFKFVLKFRINRQVPNLLCTSIKHPDNDFNLLHNWFEISNILIAVHNGVLLVIFWFIVVVIFSPFYSVAWLLDNQFCMCTIQSFFLKNHNIKYWCPCSGYIILHLFSKHLFFVVSIIRKQSRGD